MARGTGLYSQVVAWLKILLPLAALAMLSTLFLLSRSRAPVMDVPFAEVLQQGETAQEQVGAPYFAGTTARGEMLTMTARTARPEADGVIRAEELEAQLRLLGGGQIRLDAARAMLRDGSQQVHLQDGVRIESTTGYVLQTDGLVSALDQVAVESAGPVTGTGPVGRLEAGKLKIAPIGETGDVHLLFTDGVKLVYDPKTE
ncbi:MAG: LPS export ABC transporter periplasmic protein LptC [Pelagimonas sp.]|jgi:lipopolysaccharide export system protein LptC|nr:LPS export ABC transporter periplasmic protein LptC [Pelagimonas sp.]